MHVSVIGSVTVSSATAAVSGAGLGGRRARVVLVALALARGDVTPHRLASVVWGDELPPTWQVALRGVILGIRRSCASVAEDGERLIETASAGYRLARDVEVDFYRAQRDVGRAAELVAADRPQAALDLVTSLTTLSGAAILPDEDAAWLEPYRQKIEGTARQASDLTVEAAMRLGQHHLAVETARGAVAAWPLHEGSHRNLMTALTRSGDRAGAVAAYGYCRSVLADQLGVDPSAETVAVYLDVIRDQAGSTYARVPHSASSFVGRQTELAALTEAVAGSGLITVVGRGGVGKSRLVAQVALSPGGFTGAPLWVSLTAVPDEALVASTVALELGVHVGAADAAVAVAGYLGPLGPLLLVLDGCEAVTDGVASLVNTLHTHAPSLTVVVTSRWPLSIDGEHVLTVQPMTPVVGVDDLRLNSQVRLLTDRVREAGGELSVDATNAPDVAALCRRCDGLPLALELVAAQLTAMPPGDLLDHLQERGPSVGDTLRSVTRSTYELLDDDEQTVFRRAAVLEGPVSLALLREVTSDERIAAVRVVRVLRELTARGLMSVDRTGARWRYRQDDDLHQFAAQLLRDAGEEPAAYGRLADAVRSRLPDDARAAPGAFRDEITDVLASVRSLFGAALAGRADLDRCQELAFRLHRYFATTNVDEGRFWLSRLLQRGSSGPWAPYATYASGYLSYWSGDTDAAMRDLEEAVGRLASADDAYRARALIFLAGLLDDVDRGPEAVETVRAAIEAAAPHDADLQVSVAMGLGSVLAERTDPSAAGYAKDAIDLCRARASVEQLAMAMPTAAMICWQVGALDQAREYIAEALPMHSGTQRISRVVLLSAAAGVALADGDLDAACEYGSTADREATALGVERETPLIRAVLARALLARGDLAAAAGRCAAALETALGMSVAFPAAVGLETAALILDTAGASDVRAISDILGAATVIRIRGDRPAPSTLGVEIDALRSRYSGPSSPLGTAAAGRLALGLLAVIEG